MKAVESDVPELVLKLTGVRGGWCARCRFLRRWKPGFGKGNTTACCVLFGLLKTSPRGTVHGRALRHLKCLKSASDASLLRALSKAAFKPVRGSDLLKSGRMLAPYIPLTISEPLFSKKDKKPRKLKTRVQARGS